MINLPAWRLTLVPPLYDTSSKSPIEMTAQVYSKMRELVEEFNKFSEDTTKALNEFEVGIISANEDFKKYVTCTMQEYIKSIDEKIKVIDANIEELSFKYENDVKEATKELLNKALSEGTLTIAEVYNEETEALNFIVTGVV